MQPEKDQRQHLPLFIKENYLEIKNETHILLLISYFVMVVIAFLIWKLSQGNAH
jgi:hypothetical protein